MQEYVVDFPSKLGERITELSTKAVRLLLGGDSQQAESIFQNLYSEVRAREESLPEGQRFHKGSILYWWGYTQILQKDSRKIAEGYEKLLLAYIEDLLDFENFQKAREAPACRGLVRNTGIGKSLLDLVQNQVKKKRATHPVPKDPKEVLEPLLEETQEALEKPSDITFDQIEPVIQEMLKKNRPKKKRVFIGGNYRNIAVLRLIRQIVKDLDFVPIMPIDLPETSNPEYETFIHDISLKLLGECAFAIFEVTFSNGHLMEIERAKDFTHLNTILVYQIQKRGEKPTVTSMLMTKKFEKIGYRNFTELTSDINDFLLRD